MMVLYPTLGIYWKTVFLIYMNFNWINEVYLSPLPRTHTNTFTTGPHGACDCPPIRRCGGRSTSGLVRTTREGPTMKASVKCVKRCSPSAFRYLYRRRTLRTAAMVRQSIHTPERNEDMRLIIHPPCVLCAVLAVFSVIMLYIINL